jgi:hypothetical protein
MWLDTPFVTHDGCSALLQRQHRLAEQKLLAVPPFTMWHALNGLGRPWSTGMGVRAP